MGITNALIDDVDIWRRALSPQEAVAIYNAGNAGQDLQQAAANSLGLLQVTYSGGNANFVWVGGTGIRLQKATVLNPSNWADVGGTLGASSHSEPASGNAYFRLYKP